MEYAVLGSSRMDELVIMVNNTIKDGFEPIGGIFIEQDGWFYQAILKKGDK